MTKGAKSRRNHKPSINYRYNPHGGPVFDLVDDYAPNSQTNSKQPPNQPDARSSILRTSDLISGVSRLRNFATSSIPVARHKTSTQNNDGIQNKKTFYYVGSISSESQNVSVNLKADDNHVSPTVNVQKNFDFLHVTDKLRLFNYKEKSVPSVMISYEVQNIYRWMNTIQISRPPECYKEKTDYCNNAETNNVETKAPENQESSLQEYTKTDDNCSDMSSYLGSENVQDDGLYETNEGQNSHFVNQEVSAVSSLPNTQQYGLAKQEHAFAGAFAGVFVSLCLHPMDTVKTVVQSCHTDHRSIQYIGKSIISERGLSGLYRGITSNIASSAPISAIYTFSYESVKAALLPLFAKEYQSLAHCVAGGCASVATSFVFTPSERIKQQMQVGSHYNTCWNALLGIVGKGGFLSLYNGWGAVLCRNVPHSIIKFYTYESLKNVMLTSHQTHAQPTTISTLLCGGLAGSTAALFTTPFDVVKTRLQTQIPGSANRYDGVYNTLRDIAQHEGLRGLYRGLSPRLAMYMTQGALFFASYESFKKLFSLEASKHDTPRTGL